MLKLWPSTPAGQLTPKAGPDGKERQNPFFSDLEQAPSPGHQTPTYHHHLLTTTASHSSANNSRVNADLTPTNPSTPGGAGANNNLAFASALPTTQLSLHAPEFKMRPPPASSRQPSPDASAASPSPTPAASGPTSGSSSPPLAKGQIHVKLISARSLNVRSAEARPYVCVQFEQNEFVSREPTHEIEKVRDVKIPEKPKETANASPATNGSSSSALSALGAIAAKRGVNAVGHSTLVQPTTGKSTPGRNTPSTMFGPMSAHNPVWKHEVSFDVTSEESVITCNVYDGAPEAHAFLGTVQIKPALIHDHTVDQWYKLKPFENEVVTGEMRVQITYEQYKTKRALTPRDFEFLKLIGRGTFGKVFQVRKKDTRRIYAMKVLSKKEIVAKKEVAHTIGERKILQRSLDSPFLVGLKFSFQTEADLYLVTDFKSGGELFWHLQKETRFTEERARFYIAELILALEHLHKFDIVYRDLKPENILLDATGHVALCDFGLSKADLRTDELTTTFCGTTEYLAPEVLLDEHGYSKLVDFWSLGVLLFEMCCGWSPFYAEDTQQMYKNICFGKIRFPKGVINEDGKAFVKGLLNRNPKHRLGAQRDAAELKGHPFFKTIDWKALSRKQVTPPFKPVVESDECTDNFDPEFTSANIRDVGFIEAEMHLDEEDEEDWTEQWMTGSGLLHTPNGPLGSDRDPNRTGTSTPVTPSQGPARGVTFQMSGTGSQAIEMPKTRKAAFAAGTPLTNSIQEKFKGFTFHGGESVMVQVGLMRRDEDDDENAVDDEEVQEVTTDDEYEDSSAAGRYAHPRRRHLVEDDLTM